MHADQKTAARFIDRRCEALQVMRVRRRTPQEKKALAYGHDQRGTSVAKNQKSARTAVKKRKAQHHRSFRKANNQILGVAEPHSDSTEDAIESIKRQRWRKIAEPRLIEHLKNPWAGASRTNSSAAFRNSVPAKVARLRLRNKKGRNPWDERDDDL
jgi:hypothetical protein